MNNRKKSKLFVKTLILQYKSTRKRSNRLKNNLTSQVRKIRKNRDLNPSLAKRKQFHLVQIDNLAIRMNLYEVQKAGRERSGITLRTIYLEVLLRVLHQ